MRLLVVLPSWVGDAVMATPSLRILREHLPGAFIGGLMRPGIDELLNGTNFFDEAHVSSAQGMMGPKRAAAKIRPRRYDAAVLFTNSFSTALVTRLAGIPRRYGYDRDARGLLLTDPLPVPKRRDVEPFSRSSTNPGDWAPIPACQYYDTLARHFLHAVRQHPGPMGPMELVVTKTDELAADEVFDLAGVKVPPPAGASPGRVIPATRESQDTLHLAKLPTRTPPRTPRAVPTAIALLNPGGNDPAKRWPAERFAALADYLAHTRGVTVLVSGSPAERELTASIVSQAAQRPSSPTHDSRLTTHAQIVDLARHQLTLGTLKAIIARCSVMVTNDTGPRHIAAAFGVPVVTLFGPTDHRWTTIPHNDEVRILADPTLPEEEIANDHPERCAIDKIGLGDVVAATNQLLAGAATREMD
jgi:heptosyltransferase-2